jgi:uncharacterized protein YegL
MIGAPIKEMKKGVSYLLRELKKNPYALETLYMSIITFAAKANTLIPLTELTKIKPPSLSVRPGTSLGEALNLAAKSISRDVVKNTPETKGDFKPLIFIMTDGYPTDNWKKPLAKLHDTETPVDIICVGCGEDADFSVLTKISDTCIHLATLSEENLYKFFVWMSNSVGVHSKELNANKPVSLIKTPLAKGMELVTSSNKPRRKGENSWVYLICTCSKKLEKYLIRYKYRPRRDVYKAQDAYRLSKDFRQDKGSVWPPIEEELTLEGIVNCPVCGAKNLVFCDECKKVFFCIDLNDLETDMICPGCGTNAGKPTSTT